MNLPVRLLPPRTARRTGPALAFPGPGLYRADASRQLEALAAQGLPVGTLMQRAGTGVAALARALAPHARRVLILAGPGNNGGDGYEAAMQLHQAGCHATVVALGDPQGLPADGLAALERARQSGVEIRGAGDWPDLHAQDLAIDALLGRGLSRPVGGEIGAAIHRLNASGLDVLAVDLPSGLPGDTGWLGEAAGAACVRARWTLALLSLSPGLWMAQGRDQAGEIWFDDLGVTTPGVLPQASLNLRPPEPARRAHAAHKGSFGDVWVVGGADGMTGAAALAARAALQAGAGRVYLQQLGRDTPGFDPLAPELMVRPACDTSALAALVTQPSTVVAGCGGGSAIAALLPGLISHSHRLVLDADALNAVAANADLRAALRERALRGQATVLTPHPLEAARLLDVGASTVQADRQGAAAALVERYACAVVLKGSGSVMAAPGVVPRINPSGNAALSTPGTGDVLAGWLAGWWSRLAREGAVQPALGAASVTASATAAPEASGAMLPAAASNAPPWATAVHDVCAYAVWTHGRAAELASPEGQALPAGDLVQALGARARSGCW